MIAYYAIALRNRTKDFGVGCSASTKCDIPDNAQNVQLDSLSVFILTDLMSIVKLFCEKQEIFGHLVRFVNIKWVKMPN